MAPTAALIAAFLLATAGGGGRTSITDRAGDSHGAPDISSLDLGVSDSGLATFRVDVPLPAGSKVGAVSVFIDADNDPTTGSPGDGGADYVFAHYQSDLTDYFYKWIGGAQGWAPMPDANAVRATHDPKGITFSVNRARLGNASQIRVFARSAGQVSQVSALDRVPNSGTTEFDLAPFTLTVAGFHAAEAGGRLTVTMAATQSDNGQYAHSVKCALTTDGTSLRARTAAILTSGGVPTGTCVWAISKTLRGKTLHPSITESSEGRSVTRTAAVKVH